MTTQPLSDAAARSRIGTDTGSTLFVEAGAGTGKTFALVSRLGRLLLTDGVPIEDIAAITFTEKAAAELRDRLRGHLVEQSGLSREEDERRHRALAGLDTAAIGTLHAFALRLISDNPLEAGTPPRLSTQEGTAESYAAEQLWREVSGALFGPNRSTRVADAVDALLDVGIRVPVLRELVEGLHRDWDRLPDSPLHEGDLPALPHPDEVSAKFRQVLALRSGCGDDADKLAVILDTFPELRDTIRDHLDNGDAGWTTISPPKVGNKGRSGNWDDIKAVRGAVTELSEWLGAEADRYLSERVTVVVDACVPLVRAAAAKRRRAGTLQFHDQLVIARDLLRAPDVRERVRRRYRRVLIDEFQDTDPLQLEIADLLTRDDRGARVDGRLFTVGDPKQSIYRFRRADISTYLGARGEKTGDDIARLDTNFRCSRAVLEWVNTDIGGLFDAVDLVQPEYTALRAAPGRPDFDPAHGPAPFVFRTEETPELCPPEATDAHRRHWAEAADIARVIGTAVAQGWSHETRDGHQRPLGLGDIAILIPTRGNLARIEACLDTAGLEYRAEASSIVYATSEVRDLVLAVSAIADTADEAALVGALRSPLYGCGDDDLLRWRAAGGHWAPRASAPDGLEDSPVAEGLRHLADLGSRTRQPGELLESLVSERMVFEATAESPRRRELWRRIRFVIEHAWQWQESLDDPLRADLRDYAKWALALASEDARVPEAVLPEIGVDAVRITTIHAAKGLEYPMVVLGGMSQGQNNSTDRVLWFDERPVVSLSAATARMPGYDDAKDIEKAHAVAERIRLLYVATTRAESRLAVSGYGWHLNKNGSPAKGSWGALLGTICAEPDAPELLPLTGIPARGAATAGRAAPDPKEWAARSERVAETAGLPAGFSATALAHGDDGHGDDEHEGDESVPPTPPHVLAAVRGRYPLPPASPGEMQPRPTSAPRASGTEIGTAVHLLAQTMDLHTVLAAGWPTEEWRERSEQTLAALGIAEPWDVVDIAENALGSEPVRHAASREHWKELQLTGEIEGTVVDGVADLVHRGDDGSLVISDYKTDVAVTTTTVDTYLLQLAVYAALLEEATGETVSRLQLIFPRGAGVTVIPRDLRPY